VGVTRKPAVSLAAAAGRRKATVELAQRFEKEGFSGLYGPSFGDGLALCEAVALSTREIPLGTTIANIYSRHPHDYAHTAAFIHELSGGRFRFGIGVSHAPAHVRMGVTPGKPLGDIRAFVQKLRAHDASGALPPVYLATLRKGMIALAGEIADGMVFANAARSHMPASLGALPAAKASDPNFFIGDMIPTCISDDEAAAAAVNRKTLIGYVSLPNYRNYWREAGYVEEMNAIEKAISARNFDEVPKLMSDRWLSDVTLYGSVRRVRSHQPECPEALGTSLMRIGRWRKS
jgi:alkanesulfonate monooxygenase SsuD/methylene tetrahydromethanopterin reductase-like flavin-dependent oxidoreductase (luciferase family)